MRRFNTDRLADRNRLLRMGNGGLIPRVRPYGKLKNIPPVTESGLDLISRQDFAEEIKYAHENKIFPIYHMEKWLPDGTEWNQNGLNYCWSWSLTNCVSTVEAREYGFAKPLAPVSLGWTVKWKNSGNYLEDGVNAVIERGLCEASYVPDQFSRNPKTFKEGWEENALTHRVAPGKFYDVAEQDIERACVTALTDGNPCYIAYYWWSHAVPLLAVDIDDKGNLEYWIRNSHNEKTHTVMTGSRGKPSEVIVILATAL